LHHGFQGMGVQFLLLLVAACYLAALVARKTAPAGA
jgi:hypothetical protein